MKKIINIILIFTTLITMPYKVAAQSFLFGDLNRNNKIDIRDAVIIARNISKKKQLYIEADYNQDGKINIKDAAEIAKDVSKRITKINKRMVNVKQYTKADEILKLINKERNKNNLKSISINLTLNKIAEIRAKEISQNFSHNRLDGTSFYTILDNYHINYYYCGENIAAGNSSAVDTMKQWINSASHYKNIIDSNFNQVGIGYYYNKNSIYKHYWVQIFDCE